MADFGIVGGGFLGMVLAWRLQGAGHRVTIFESAPDLGGLAGSMRLGDVIWDRFYHVILLSDSSLLGLLADLGLGDRLMWGTTRTGFYSDGRLLSLSTSLDFLRFPPLSFFDKCRLAATILYASRIRDGRALEHIPVETWLRRWSGRRTFERIWLPLLQSKLGDNYRLASAAFIWAIIARMYAARRSGLKRELFGYVEGGYATVLQRLRARLEAAGVIIRCAAPVGRILPLDRETGHGIQLELPDGEVHRCDEVVVTAPSSRVAALCPALSEEERTRLAGITYQGIVSLAVLLRPPLGGYYVTNVTDAGFPFTGVIEMTALVDRSTFGGRTLVYLPRYLTQDDPLWRATDAEVTDRFLAGLMRMYPTLTASDVVASDVSRVREVLAVSTLDYSSRCLPSLHTSVPGLWIVNSAQIANGTLNLNETVSLANLQADRLLTAVGPVSGPGGNA
jgi:protoporphyrinogen oxidase